MKVNSEYWKGSKHSYVLTCTYIVYVRLTCTVIHINRYMYKAISKIFEKTPPSNSSNIVPKSFCIGKGMASPLCTCTNLHTVKHL